MANIAEIGFRSDTSGLEKAETSLERLTPAAAKTEAQATKTSAAINKVSAAADGMSGATDNATKVLNAANGALTTNAAKVAQIAGSYTDANGRLRDVNGRFLSLNDNIDKNTEALKENLSVQSRINALTGANKDQFSNIGRAADIEAYGKSMDDLRAKYNPLFAAGQQYKSTLLDIKSALKVGAISQEEYNNAIMNTKVAFVEQVNSMRGIDDQFKMFNATIGNSAKPLDDLRAKYNPLMKAQQEYKAFTSDLSNALKVGAISQDEYNNALKTFVPTVGQATGEIEKHAGAHAGLSTQAMAAQHSIRSMVEMLAMGIPPTQILSSQMNHLSYAATGPGGIKAAFGEVLGLFTKFLTVTVLLVGAIALIIGAFALAYIGTVRSAVALDDLSKSTDVAIGKLHGLQLAAGFKGISKDDFADGMKKFSDSVYDAQRNMGGLNGLMIANNKSAKDFEGYLMNVADLVAKTTSDVQKQKILQEASLPATRNWVELMSQGSKGIKAVIAGTGEFNDAAEKNMIKKARDFEDAWNRVTTNFSEGWKTAVITTMGWYDTLKNKVKELNNSSMNFNFKARFDAIDDNPARNNDALRKGLGNVAAGKPADASGGGAKTQAELLAANQQAQSRISILGDLATVEQKVHQTELNINAARLQGIGPAKDMDEKIKNATRSQEEQNKVQAQAASGIFDLNKARKAASDTLQTWIDKELVDKNNAEQMAAAQLVLARSIKSTSDAAAVAAAPLQQLKQLQLDGSNFAKQLDTTVTGSLNNMVAPIQDVMNGVTSLGQGFKNVGLIVVKAIQEMIIKMLIITPIAKALMSILNPFAGMFGGAAAGGATGASALAAGITPVAKGGLFGANDNKVSMFAKGGAFANRIYNKITYFAHGGGIGAMGEAGPEAVMPLKRGPDGSLGVQMYGTRTGNDGGALQITYAPVNHLAPGVTPQELEMVKRNQQEDRETFIQRVGQAIPEIRRRGGGV